MQCCKIPYIETYRIDSTESHVSKKIKTDTSESDTNISNNATVKRTLNARNARITNLNVTNPVTRTLFSPIDLTNWALLQGKLGKMIHEITVVESVSPNSSFDISATGNIYISTNQNAITMLTPNNGLLTASTFNFVTGVNARFLLFDNKNNRLFATNFASNAVHVTTNNGNTWTAITGGGLSSVFDSLDFDPISGNIVGAAGHATRFLLNNETAWRSPGIFNTSGSANTAVGPQTRPVILPNNPAQGGTAANVGLGTIKLYNQSFAPQHLSNVMVAAGTPDGSRAVATNLTQFPNLVYVFGDSSKQVGTYYLIMVSNAQALISRNNPTTYPAVTVENVTAKLVPVTWTTIISGHVSFTGKFMVVLTNSDIYYSSDFGANWMLLQTIIPVNETKLQGRFVSSVDLSFENRFYVLTNVTGVRTRLYDFFLN